MPMTRKSEQLSAALRQLDIAMVQVANAETDRAATDFRLARLSHERVAILTELKIGHGAGGFARAQQAAVPTERFCPLS